MQLTDRQVVMIASPEKALCDKIVMTAGIVLRTVKQTRQFLVEDMRIDEDMLQALDWRQIDSGAGDAPKRGSIAMLGKTLGLL